MTDDRAEYLTASALATTIEIGARLPDGVRDDTEIDEMRRLLRRIVPTDRSRVALTGLIRMRLASLDEEA